MKNLSTKKFLTPSGNLQLVRVKIGALDIIKLMPATEVQKNVYNSFSGDETVRIIGLFNHKEPEMVVKAVKEGIPNKNGWIASANIEEVMNLINSYLFSHLNLKAIKN